MDITVNLSKVPGQPLGIGFKKLARPPHCQVFKMAEDGVASGLVHKGDLLLSINGLNVQHLNPAEIGSVFERYNNNPHLVLEVRRSLANGNLNVSETNSSIGSDFVQNGHPVINVEPTSPDRLSPIDDSSSPRKNKSNSSATPNSQRTRKKLVMESNTLHQIDEDVIDHKLNGVQMLNTVQSTSSQRHSFTPEAVRKPLEDHRKTTPMRSSKSLDLGVLPQWRVGNMQSVHIHNLLDGSEMTDRLNNKRISVS